MSKETVHFEEKEYKTYEVIAKKKGFKTVDNLVNHAIKELVKRELIETEQVQVWIPKKLLKFVRDHRSEDLEEYLSDLLTDSIAADLMTGDYGTPDKLKKEYDMIQEFQFYEGH